jgi:hypothetical protein
MPKSEIEASRRQSRAPNSLMWTKFWGEGARKTVLKRCAKQAPSSSDLEQLFRRDDELPELPAPETVEPLPAPPTREQFIDKPASEEHDEPESEEDEPEPEDEDEPEEEEPEAAEAPFILVDAHGEEHQVDGAANAAEGFRAALQEAAKIRQDLGVSACWENNAALIFELRERGYDQLADGLVAAYAEELAAADAAALPATPMKARAAVRGKAAVPPAAKIDEIKPKQLAAGRTSGWDWAGYADEVIAAARQLPRDQLAAFRVTQAQMLNTCRGHSAGKPEWSRIQQALAEHEREGTA